MAQETVQRSSLHIVMACVPKNSASFVGRKSICAMDDCTSIEPKAELRAFIHCTVLSSERCGHCKGARLTCSWTEAGTPVTTAWFLRMLQRTGEATKLPFAVHPHMLRHACDYKLANDGHDTRSLAHYLGHRNLQSTARYTALAPDRFAKFWQD